MIIIPGRPLLVGDIYYSKIDDLIYVIEEVDFDFITVSNHDLGETLIEIDDFIKKIKKKQWILIDKF